MPTTSNEVVTICDRGLLQHGKQFANMDAARQGETDGAMEDLTDQWWSLAQQVAQAKPSTIAGIKVQLGVLRRIIEDSYLTDECHADALVRQLFANLTATPLLT
jgi:hypothetical protein